MALKSCKRTMHINVKSLRNQTTPFFFPPMTFHEQSKIGAPVICSSATAARPEESSLPNLSRPRNHDSWKGTSWKGAWWRVSVTGVPPRRSIVWVALGKSSLGRFCVDSLRGWHRKASRGCFASTHLTVFFLWALTSFFCNCRRPC